MAARRSAAKGSKKARSPKPAARYFDPSQLAMAVAAERSAPRTLADRSAAAYLGTPPGAIIVEHAKVRGAPFGVDQWTVIVSPDRTCAFAFSGQQLDDDEGTQRLMHWAVAWSEPPAAHTMWQRCWARLARVKKGSAELRPEGVLCRICRTRDPEKCEGIRRAHRALSIALLGRQ